MTIFSEVPTEQLSHLAAITSSVNYQKDDVLFNEKDESDKLYILLSGSLEMIKQGKVIYEVEPSQTVGALGFFDQHPRLFKAVCKEDCQFLVIEATKFFDLLGQRIRIAQYILKYFVKQLRSLYDSEEKLNNITLKSL